MFNMFTLSKYIAGPIFTEFCDGGGLSRLDTAVCNHEHRQQFHDQIGGQTTRFGLYNDPHVVNEVALMWLKSRNMFTSHYIIETPLLNVFDNFQLHHWFQTLARRAINVKIVGENAGSNNVYSIQRVAKSKRAGNISDKKGWELFLEHVTSHQLTSLTVAKLTAHSPTKLKSLYNLLNKCSQLAKLVLDCVPGLDVGVVRIVLTQCVHLSELCVINCFTSVSDVLPQHFEVSYPIQCNLKCVVWKSGLLKLFIPVLQSNKTCAGLQSIVVDLSRGVGNEEGFKCVLMDTLKRSMKTLDSVEVRHVTEIPMMFGFGLIFSVGCKVQFSSATAPLNYMMKRVK